MGHLPPLPAACLVHPLSRQTPAPGQENSCTRSLNPHKAHMAVPHHPLARPCLWQSPSPRGALRASAMGRVYKSPLGLAALTRTRRSPCQLAGTVCVCVLESPPHCGTTPEISPVSRRDALPPTPDAELPAPIVDTLRDKCRTVRALERSQPSRARSSHTADSRVAAGSSNSPHVRL